MSVLKHRNRKDAEEVSFSPVELTPESTQDALEGREQSPVALLHETEVGPGEATTDPEPADAPATARYLQSLLERTLDVSFDSVAGHEKKDNPANRN